MFGRERILVMVNKRNRERLDVQMTVLNENLRKYGNLEQFLDETEGKIRVKFDLNTKCAHGYALCAYTREEKTN